MTNIINIKPKDNERAEALRQHLFGDIDYPDSPEITKYDEEVHKFLINEGDDTYIDARSDNHLHEGDYLVLTDEEADKKVEEDIRDSLWAFKTSFLASHTDVDVTVISKLQELCESSNEAIFTLIKDFDHFVEEAILSDGRGHFLSKYDGHEYEEKAGDTYYYIYRVQ